MRRIFIVFAMFVVGVQTAYAVEMVKEITFQDDYAEVLVRTIIKSSPQAVWAALKDIERWPKWLPMSRRAKVLSKEAEGLVTPENAPDKTRVLEIDKLYPSSYDSSNRNAHHWQSVVYEEYDLPWPIKNEWVVRRYTYDEGDVVFRASWRRLESKRDGEDGFWEVRPGKMGYTELTYTYHVKPKGPKPLFKIAISLTVDAMFKALRDETHRLDENAGAISLR